MNRSAADRPALHGRMGRHREHREARRVALAARRENLRKLGLLGASLELLAEFEDGVSS
jgi:hypothetical protein